MCNRYERKNCVSNHTWSSAAAALASSVVSSSSSSPPDLISTTLRGQFMATQVYHDLMMESTYETSATSGGYHTSSPFYTSHPGHHHPSSPYPNPFYPFHSSDMSSGMPTIATFSSLHTYTERMYCVMYILAIKKLALSRIQLITGVFQK